MRAVKLAFLLMVMGAVFIPGVEAATGPIRDQTNPGTHQTSYEVERTADGGYVVTQKPGFRRIFVKVKGVLHSLYLTKSGRFALSDPHPSEAYREANERILGDRLIETDDLSKLHITFVGTDGKRYDLNPGDDYFNPVPQSGGTPVVVDNLPQPGGIGSTSSSGNGSVPLCQLVGTCPGGSGNTPPIAGGNNPPSGGGGGGTPGGPPGSGSSSSSGGNFPILPPPTNTACRTGNIERPILGGSGWASPSGKKIYVSPNGSGTGASQSTPTKFANALQTAGAGDAIVALPGTYPGMNITRGGTPDKPLFIMAATPAVKVTPTGMALASESLRVKFSSVITVLASNVVLDGLTFATPGGSGLYFNKPSGSSKKIILTGGLVRNSVFYEQRYSAQIYNRYAKVAFYGNYFYRNATKRPGANPGGYGIAVFQSDPQESNLRGPFDFQGNWFEGAYNHALSFKKYVYNATIANNVFRCGGKCLDIGQSPDGNFQRDNTGGDVQIVRNCFDFAYGAPGGVNAAMKIDNQTHVTVANNQFYGFPKNIWVGYIRPGGDPERQTFFLGQFGPIYPKSISILNNFFRGGSIVVEGRGSPRGMQTATISGNRGTVSQCAVLPSDAPDWNWGNATFDKNFNREKPRLTASDNSFACKP